MTRKGLAVLVLAMVVAILGAYFGPDKPAAPAPSPEGWTAGDIAIDFTLAPTPKVVTAWTRMGPSGIHEAGDVIVLTAVDGTICTQDDYRSDAAARDSIRMADRGYDFACQWRPPITRQERDAYANDIARLTCSGAGDDYVCTDRYKQVLGGGLR